MKQNWKPKKKKKKERDKENDLMMTTKRMAP